MMFVDMNNVGPTAKHALAIQCKCRGRYKPIFVLYSCQKDLLKGIVRGDQILEIPGNRPFDDDHLMLLMALKFDAKILSNDSFQNFISVIDSLTREWLQEHLVRFSYDRKSGIQIVWK